MIYFIVFAILLGFTIAFDHSYNGTSKKYSRKVAVVVSFIMLSLLAGLRYRVGTDTLSYMDEYYGDPSSYFRDKYLFGWYLLISVCKSLHLSFYVVQLILAFFTNYAVITFLKRYANHFFSSLLLYYVIVYPALNFEILRQGICISIFLLSFAFLDNKSYIKYLICVGIACLFHYSALALLLVPLVTWIPINKKSTTIFLAIIAIVIALSSLLKEQIYQISMGLSFWESRSYYYFSKVDTTESFSPVSFIFNLTLNVVIPFLIIRYQSYSEKVTRAFLAVCMFSMIIYVVSAYMPIIYRFNNYFQIFSLVLFVDLFNRIRIRIKGKPFLVFLIALLFFTGVKARVYFADIEGTPGYYRYYPYSSIFNEFKIPQRENGNLER